MKKLDFGEDKPSELNQEQLQALEKKSVEVISSFLSLFPFRFYVSFSSMRSQCWKNS